MMFLKQSTAVDVPVGPFVDSTDGNTAETALTITQPDIRLKKNGAAWAQKSAAQTLSHEEAGWYEVSLSTTDTDTLGHLMLAIHESGALPVWREFMVLPANVYDGLVGGTDVLQVDVSQFGNAAGTFASGRPEVNTTHAAGTAWGSGAITAGAIAADAIGASELAADAATEIATAVWAAAVRTLTANTNLSIMTAADIRAAIGMSSANLDTQLAGIAAFIDTEVAAILSQVNALPDANSNADALLTRADGIYTGYTPADALRIIVSAVAGKSSGHGTSNVKYRDLPDSKDVIDATVSGGNRTAITLDATA